jgi:hypothetical protein
VIDRDSLPWNVVRALLFKALALLALYFMFFGPDHRTIVSGDDIRTAIFQTAPANGER